MTDFAGNFLPSSRIEWDQVKAALLEEFDWSCQFCGTPLVWKTATIDHAIPRCQGGTDHFANLGPACGRCNSSKGGRTIDQWRDAQEARAAR